MAICHSLTDGMPEGGVAMVVADGGGVVGVVGGGRSGYGVAARGTRHVEQPVAVLEGGEGRAPCVSGWFERWFEAEAQMLQGLAAQGVFVKPISRAS